MMSLALIGLELILYALVFIWLGLFLDHWFLWNSWGRTGYLVGSTVGYLLVFIVRIRVHGPMRSKQTLDGIRWQLLLMLVAIGVGLSPILFLDHIPGRLERFGDHRKAHPSTTRFRIVIPETANALERGTPLTLSAYVEADNPDTVPATATLLVRESRSAEPIRIPMRAVGQAIHDVSLPPVQQSFSYAIEIGDEQSDWHSVTVTEPFDRLPDSALVVDPPDYARTVQPQHFPSGSRITALQESRLQLHWRFNQSVAQAWLKWQTEPNLVSMERFPITPNNLQINTEFPLEKSGQLIVTVVNHEGLQKSWTVDVTVVADQPPRWIRVDGIVATSCPVGIDTEITIDAAITDDVGIDRLFLEYCFDADHSAIRRVAIDPSTTIQKTIRIKDLAVIGQSIDLRLRAEDLCKGDRRRSITYPRDGWTTLNVIADAPPYTQSTIDALEAQTANRLDLAVRKIESAQSELMRLSESQPLKIDPSRWLTAFDNAQLGVEDANEILHHLAEELNLKSELHQLGDQITSLQNDTIDPTLRRLQILRNQPATKTDVPLRRLDSELLGIKTQLLGLQTLNASHAQHRRDHTALEALADSFQSGAPLSAEGLLDIIEASPELRKSVLATAMIRRELLGNTQTRLAEHITLWLDSLVKTRRSIRIQRTATLRQQQEQWNDKAKGLTEQWDLPLRLSDTQPLRMEFLEAARSTLAKGQPAEAATNLEQIALDLDRLVVGMSRHSMSQASLHDLLLMLAAWQSDLAQRFADESSKRELSNQSHTNRTHLLVEQQQLIAMLETIAEAEPALEMDIRIENCCMLAKQALAKFQTGEADGVETIRRSAMELHTTAKLTPTPERNREQRLTRLKNWHLKQQALAKAIRSSEDKEGLNRFSKQLRELSQTLQTIDLSEFPGERHRILLACQRLDVELRKDRDTQTALLILDERSNDLLQVANGKSASTSVYQQLTRDLAAIDQALAVTSTPINATQRKEWIQILTRSQRELQSLRTAELAWSQRSCERALQEITRLLQRSPLPTIDTVRERVRQSITDMKTMTDRSVGSVSPLSVIQKLQHRQTDLLDAVRLRNGAPSNQEIINDTVADVEAMLKELRHTPVGSAVHQSRQALAALQTLTQDPQLDIEPRRQIIAVHALDDLVRAIRKSEDATQTTAWVGPPPPGLLDRLRSMAGFQALPNEHHIGQMQRMIQQARALRDEATRHIAIVQAQYIPSPTDPMGTLVIAEQLEVNESIRAVLALSNRSYNNDPIRRMIDRLALLMHVGMRAEATQLSTDIEARLSKYAEESSQWQYLVVKQRRIINSLKQLPDEPSIVLARLDNDFHELRQETIRLRRNYDSLILAWPNAEPMLALAKIDRDLARLENRLNEIFSQPTDNELLELRAIIAPLKDQATTRRPGIEPINAHLLECIEKLRRVSQPTLNRPENDQWSKIRLSVVSDLRFFVTQRRREGR